MKSKETKKRKLNEARLKRARALIGVDPFGQNTEPPKGPVMADRKELAHNNTYGPLPRFYEVGNAFAAMFKRNRISLKEAKKG